MNCLSRQGATGTRHRPKEGLKANLVGRQTVPKGFAHKVTTAFTQSGGTVPYEAALGGGDFLT